MDGSRNEFFSRSRLAQNQHRRFRRRHHLDLIQHSPQSRTPAHDPFKILLRNLSLSERTVA
jgi:hypothetical protein